MRKKLLLAAFLLSIILFISTTIGQYDMNNNLNDFTGVDVYVKLSDTTTPASYAYVKCNGVSINYCEEQIANWVGKCRFNLQPNNTYNFCSYKDNYGDSKTVYISGGSQWVYLYLSTYGLSCTPCNYPEKK